MILLYNLMNMRFFLFLGYLISILTSSLILIWVYSPLDYIIWLFAPLIVHLLFSVCITITRNKEQRDFI